MRMYVFVNEKVASSNFFLIFFFDLRQAGTNRSKFSLLFRVLPAVSPRKNTYYAIATRETKKNLALAHPILCDVYDFNSERLRLRIVLWDLILLFLLQTPHRRKDTPRVEEGLT